MYRSVLISVLCVLSLSILYPMTASFADDPISDIITDLNVMVSAETDIDGLSQQIEQSTQGIMTGQYNWGTLGFNDKLQSWGNDTQDWSSILSVAQSGGSSSDYGKMVQQLSGQYPINTGIINQTNPNKTDQQFYQLKSQTALAARAASQLDYDDLQKQIEYQQSLQKNIDSTQDVKAAIDLQNRLQVEGNLINLELLRQLSLLNQQKSIESQEEANAAVENAQFLKYTP